MLPHSFFSKTDYPRPIDRYIDFFGGTASARSRLACAHDPFCASTMAPVTPSNPWASSPETRVGPGAS
jgi:hypothetical protein